MHECPNCGQACDCRGDIDDIVSGPWNLCECPCEIIDDEYEPDPEELEDWQQFVERHAK